MHHANNQRRDRGKFAPEYKSDMSSSAGDLMSSLPVEDDDDDWGYEQPEPVTPEPTTSVPGWEWNREADDFVRSDDHSVTSGQERQSRLMQANREGLSAYNIAGKMAQIDREVPRNPHAQRDLGGDGRYQPKRPLEYENMDLALSSDEHPAPARDPYAPAKGFGQLPAQSRDSGLPQPKQQRENFDIPLEPNAGSTGSSPARDPYAPAKGFGQPPPTPRGDGRHQPKRPLEANLDLAPSATRGAGRFFG